VINFHTPVLLDIELDHALSLDFDDDEGIVITTFLAQNKDDEGAEVDTPLSLLIDEVIDLFQFDADFQSLYCIAHELDRLTEKVRDTAQRMEDTTLVEDLFNVDPDDLPEVDV